MSRLSKNIVYNLLGQGIILILGFIAVKYIFNQLGEDALGLIYFTLMLNAVLCTVLEMGICSTTVREVSAHHNDEPAYVRELVRTASLFYWVAYASLAVAIYFGASLIVGKWITLETMDPATAILILQVLGASALLALPHSFYSSLFRGLQRMEITNAIDVGTSGLQQVGTILILSMGGGLLQVIYWISLCFILSILADLLLTVRFFSWKAVVPGYSSWVVGRNRRFSLHMMSISILATIHTHTDKLIISKLLPISALGFYGFVSGAVSRSTLVTKAVSQAALPSFSTSFEAGDRAGMMVKFRKLHDLLCFSMVPLFAAISFSAIPLFSFLFNQEVAQELFLPVVFLCVGYYMNGTLTVPYVFSLAVGMPEISTRANLLALFIVLPVMAVLIYFFGLVGAALSWVFYHLFAYSYTIPKICSKCLEISIYEWFLHLMRIMILTGITYGTAWVLLVSSNVYTVEALSAAYLGASVVYAVAAYRMIGEELRGTLSLLFLKWKGRRPEVA